MYPVLNGVMGFYVIVEAEEKEKLRVRSVAGNWFRCKTFCFFAVQSIRLVRIITRFEDYILA